ncbi:MAG: hypothetical protein ABEH88_06160, partial [Halobacteriales archaeon]
SPGIGEAVFEAGVLLVGSLERAEKLPAELLAPALLPFEVINALTKTMGEALVRLTGGPEPEAVASLVSEETADNVCCSLLPVLAATGGGDHR